MRLLMVTAYHEPAYVYGGTVSSISHLCKMFLKLEIDVKFFTTNASGTGDLETPTEKPVLVNGLLIHYFRRWWFGCTKKPSRIFFSPAMGRSLAKIKNGDFDLICIHSSFCDPGRLAFNAARRTGIPYICYTHGSFEPWAIQHKYWKKIIYMSLVERRILKHAAGIIVCNEAETKQLREMGVKTPIRKIPWGVDIPDPDKIPNRQKLEELYPALSGRPFLLFLSRLHPKKGLDLLFPAFASLSQQFPDWLLVIAGPSESGYKEKVLKLVATLDLGNRVLLTGMVTGELKAALLAQAEFLTLPSFSEGFPMVVAEALGYGRPVVITETCYMPEVGEYGAGLVVPVQRQALTTALGEMMGDTSLRMNCSQNAIKLARNLFTWEAVAKQNLEFYREIINVKR